MISEETRQKMRKAHLEYWQSEKSIAHRETISKNSKKPKSDETKAKMSAAHKVVWQKRLQQK